MTSHSIIRTTARIITLYLLNYYLITFSTQIIKNKLAKKYRKDYAHSQHTRKPRGNAPSAFCSKIIESTYGKVLLHTQIFSPSTVHPFQLSVWRSVINYLLEKDESILNECLVYLVKVRSRQSKSTGRKIKKGEIFRGLATLVL